MPSSHSTCPCRFVVRRDLGAWIPATESGIVMLSVERRLPLQTGSWPYCASLPHRFVAAGWLAASSALCRPRHRHVVSQIAGCSSGSVFVSFSFGLSIALRWPRFRLSKGSTLRSSSVSPRNGHRRLVLAFDVDLAVLAMTCLADRSQPGRSLHWPFAARPSRRAHRPWASADAASAAMDSRRRPGVACKLARVGRPAALLGRGGDGPSPRRQWRRRRA